MSETKTEPKIIVMDLDRQGRRVWLVLDVSADDSFLLGIYGSEEVAREAYTLSWNANFLVSRVVQEAAGS